ncbi:restriction endonuclease [Oceanibaculum indicum]|uniref:Restriction system protein n=1 Tax=Oceanibaculum indicum P24 TaxID=1207063 RepID=K2J6W5_9PROT|nr:restriction endonuclease [Oceanibaculum indicum]EKE78816.1 restriction system protein [Oceanibaculum indicum P24]
MAIPDFQTLMLPVLKASANGEVHISEVVNRLAIEFGLTDAERVELLPSRRQATFDNRVHWAKSYLGKAGLVEMTGRGRFQISERGRKVLSKPPKIINIKFLEQFPEFALFRKPSETGTPAPAAKVKAVEKTGSTPDELIREAHAGLEAELSQEILQRIQAAPPAFFERIVVQLLVAMGYGGSTGQAGEALVIGRSGDGGIDGVIDQDALGLDRVYVQAKRYADGNIVGAGAIRDFFGALDGFKAAKGLFVTTSSFSASAKQTAESLSKRIVLIDGVQLARLMIRYDVGCRIEETLYIKKIDEDFFE